MEDPDAALVAAARNGDRAAMDDLLRRHYDRIHTLCRRMARNDADALDATQEALITIVRRLDRFDGRSTFATWSYRVASNACLDELRRRGRRPEPVDDAVLDRGAATTADHGDRVLELDAMSAALQQVDEVYRVPLVLRDVHDLDYRQISEQLGVPPGTVKSRIARGRRALAQILGTESPSTDVQRDADV